MALPFSEWVELLQSRAASTPDTLIYRFLQMGDVDGPMVEQTYAEFEARVRAIAARLQAQGQPGDRALLLYAPGIDFIEAFFACLYAGMVAIPAYPPDPGRLARTLPRLRGIVADAQPSVVMTTSFVAGFAEMLMPQAPELAELSWMSTDEIPADGAGDWRRPDITPDTLAFLQYTSGSTGRPKGVMLNHHNLMMNEHVATERLGLGGEGHMVSWLPQYHDMGLIGGCLNPVFNGYGATLMAPMSFLQRPVRWVQALSTYGGTVTAGPNFAYDLVARKISDEELATLDLSRWRAAVNGAEPVRAEVAERFLKKFGPVGFSATTYFPSYGMAEATLFISAKERDAVLRTLTVDDKELQLGLAKPAEEGAEGGLQLVSCGKQVDGHEIAIVDPVSLVENPAYKVGEIWLRGPSNAQGYWRRPEETAHTFGALIEGRGEGTWLRTGDLGFLDADDEVYITGRHKDLIIVRGRNHYPQDIEFTVEECDPAMRPGCSAAYTLDVKGEERLAVSAEIDPRKFGKGEISDMESAIRVIRTAIATNHGVQPYAISLLKNRSIPKTTSGKIQRHGARLEFLDGSGKVLHQWVQELAEEAPEEAAGLGRGRGEILNWIMGRIAGFAGVKVRDLDPGAPFMQHGLDSLKAVELVGELEDFLGVPVPISALWDHPNALALAARFGEGGEEEPAFVGNSRSDEAIAVVGMGCRFPGADNPQAFWELLDGGVDSIGAPPLGRWSEVPGGYLHDVDQFDPEFFGISPREARGMDPQQRLLMEVCWEALESAGLSPESLAGTATGVFVGIASSDYGFVSISDPEKADAYSGTGNAHSIAANRLSYLLDLRGPSMALDTACSSSLVAVHQAVAALRSGEIRRAIVGGVNLLLSPQATEAFKAAGMLAADARCKTFDAAADGYVRGEGCGVLVLERLSTAELEGDRVHAVIRGTALNQDGRSNGLTAPSGTAQRRVIRSALADAGASPDELGYVEAHGTGTSLGDPIEVNALSAVIGERGEAAGPVWLGSVKTNIGHLEAAAGMAGLIKVVLSMQHGRIPRHLHFKEPNPGMNLGALQVSVEAQPWPGKKLAGVSGFGFGGTNAHVILAPAEAPAPSEPGRALSVLTLSARDAQPLAQLAEATRGALVAGAVAGETFNTSDFCYSLNAGRSQQRHRLALIGDRDALLKGLADISHRSVKRGEAPPAAPKVGFLFTGQGAQYAGMGMGLYATEPVFAEVIDQCAEALGERLGAPLLQLLAEDADPEALDHTAVTQPALFCLQVALAALWRSWGVVPDAVTGHSVGAYAAAVVAGALTLEDGLRMVTARGRLMGALPSGGSMAAIQATEAEVAEVLKEMPDAVGVAAINGPSQVVISGLANLVDQACEALGKAGHRVTPLTVSHAFHSALMEPMLLEFTQLASEIRFSEPTLALVSDHDGQVLDGARARDPLYWRDHVRQAVRFTDAMKTLDALGCQAYVEIGPAPVLIGMGRRCLPASDAVWLQSLRKGRDDQKTLLTSLAEAWVHGLPVDWEGFEGDRPRQKLSLPTTPFQRRRCWVDDGRSANLDVLRVSWEAASANRGALSGRWALLGQLPGFEEALAEAGGELVTHQDEACRGVIDARALAGGSAEGLLSAAVQGLKGASCPVFLVTRGAAAVVDADGVDPAQAALWGLGRAFAQERPQRWGGLIDVDKQDPVGAVLTELAQGHSGQGQREQAAWRAGQRYVSRLVSESLPLTDTSIHADASYLITGGVGALGLQVAAWLKQRGARHLVLTSRSGGRSEAVEALAQGGVQVDVAAVDVADAQGMAKLIMGLPKLKGVIHAAGVVQRASLDALTEEALKATLRAKVAGSRMLDALTRRCDLDFFVFFSSVSALWGGPGLLAYAAANAFEDGLAQARVSAGVPGLSVGWGVWADGGMASDEERVELARAGLGALSPRDALQRMGALLGHSGHLALAEVDWTRLRPLLEARAPAPLYSRLGRVAGAERAASSALLERLRATPEDGRKAVLIEVIRDELRRVGELGEGAPVPLDAGFFDLGLDSIMAVEVKTHLEGQLGRPLPATLLMDQPDLGRLVTWLLGELDLSGPAAQLQVLGARSEEPIAVVGMACKLPGGGDSPEALWRLLCSGEDAVAEVPADRWDIDAWYDPSPDALGKMYARRGGFVDGVDLFDAGFFGINAREAKRMDPQHRMLLETAWQAMEDAGQSPARSGEMRSGGVFIGIGSNDYLQSVIGALPPEQVDAYSGTGNAMAFAAGRLAFHLGLQGPAMATDTACSSSLVATHLACKSLREGECELALAGGVNLILDPTVSVYLSRARALSPDGRCKTFDARADGYVRGEGCGVVVLKRLSDAQRDGDRVLALIRGSAVNHDGRSSGITVPNGPAQQQVIRAALADAGMQPEQVGYIEAHGTGTGLGDPIEVGALAAVLGTERPLVVGTLKSNIGHLEAASGIAGLIKAVMCVQRGAIPPNLHFETQNPHIDARIPLEVPTALRPWDAEERVAGVSAFGLSGTNAHVLVSQAPAAAPIAPAAGPFALPLSAHTPQALAELRDGVVAALAGGASAQDVCHTLAGRAQLPYRLVVVGDSAEALREALAAASPLEQAAVPREAPELEVPAAPSAADLARLFAAGLSLDWRAHTPAGQQLSLLHTPFQRKRHWMDVEASAPTAAATAKRADGEAFLGRRLRIPLLDAVVFEAEHQPASPVWLDHHRLFGRVVTPGAAHIALSLAAARESRGVSSASVVEVSFSRALILNDDEVRTVQIVLDGAKGDVGFKVASVLSGGAQLHASGRLLEVTHSVAAPGESLESIRGRLSKQGSPEAFYEDFARVGYTLGPAFRWMGETWRRDGEALCRMVVPAPDIGLGDAPLHPGLIDSCFQLLTRCLPEEKVAEVLDGDAIFVPVAVARFTWLGGGEGALWAHAILREEQVADIWLRGEDGGVRAFIEGLRVARIPRAVLGGAPRAPDDVYEQRWVAATLADEERGTPPQEWAVIDDGEGAGEALVEALRARGRRASLVQVPGPSAQAVAYLRGLRLGAQEGVDDLLQTLRALPDAEARLYVVTRGAIGLLGEAPSLPQAALLGLQRVVAMERPSLRCTSIDLDPSLPARSVSALVEELDADVDADQVALRLSGRLVARLSERASAAPPSCSRWTVEQPGSLESVRSQPAERVAPGPGKVEIHTRATALNFRDVLGALGAYPGDPGPLGGECAGVISAVGEGVTGLAVGDRVVNMLAESGGFRTHVISEASFVAKLPDTLEFGAAATLPVAYATAAHGLETLAKLGAGERVLIHAASGGVGMAAVQLAQAAGAEIFATAGSEEKRQVLREAGIAHVFNSRDLDYVAKIREITGGEGVDVVLNSLGVEHVRECLALTKPGGRFVEIGKADVLDEARVAGLGKPLSYFHFDLVTMSVAEPERIQALLVEAMARFARGTFRALPQRSFPLSDTVAAFRHMARARHVGKVVIRWPEPAADQLSGDRALRADRSYLVTGGLGALGLELASWLAQRGAGSLLLLGRSAPSEAALEVINSLRAEGAQVHTAQVDVTDRAALQAVVDGLSAPLGGVFHAAGVLDDALIDEQTPARVQRVFSVKRDGGWNLHEVAGDVEHFVLFSSVSGVLGSAGQASYAAANAWLDGLAAWRRSQGLSALSVAWGPWGGGGMAASTDGKGRWSRVGISPLEPEAALNTMGALMAADATRAVVLPIDRAKMARGLSLGPVPPLMLELLEQQEGGDARAEDRRELREELLAASDPEARFDTLVDYLCVCLATVTEEDEVDPEAPLDDNDSLVAVEFTSLVEKELGLSLPMEEVFELENLMDVAEMIGGLLDARG